MRNAVPDGITVKMQKCYKHVHSPRQSALGGPPWAGGLEQMAWGPFQPQLFCDSVTEWLQRRGIWLLSYTLASIIPTSFVWVEWCSNNCWMNSSVCSKRHAFSSYFGNYLLAFYVILRLPYLFSSLSQVTCCEGSHLLLCYLELIWALSWHKHFLWRLLFLSSGSAGVTLDGQPRDLLIH